jgi:hypothetical protein
MATVFGLVNPQGLIENAFYWHEGDVYPCEEGYSIVRIDNVENCGIGWSYIDGVFVEPVQEETTPVEQPISQGAQTL